MVSKTKAMEQLTHKMKKIVRTGGPDPKFNKDLAQLQLEYRAANFSDETFQRVLKNVQVNGILYMLFDVFFLFSRGRRGRISRCMQAVCLFSLYARMPIC